jgi:predicted aspartyl protease
MARGGSIGATGCRRRECLSTKQLQQSTYIPSAPHFFKSSHWLLAAFLHVMVGVHAFGGDLTSGTPPPKERITEIPFALYAGYLIVVEGRIGNLDHQNLLIDTGTSPSMIDKSVEVKLKLQGAAGGIALFNTSVSGERVTLPQLELGPLQRRNLQVMVTDFSKIARGVGTRIDAVIGLDVLGESSFTIDYQKHKIYFRSTQERHSAPFTAGPRFITVDLKAGGRQLRLLLDTGTPHLVLFKRALINLDYDPSVVTGTGQNISGTISYGNIVLPQARFGNDDLGPARASVVASQESAASEYDGLIGLSMLRPKRLSFDFEHQVLGWTN